MEIELTVNGEQVQASVSVRTNLVDFLREELGLTGSHIGCEQGVCGACTIEVNGSMVRSCLMLAVQADGAVITTIEGYGHRPVGQKLQSAFVKHNALQCGFCTPGMLASGIEYIEQGGDADRDSIRRHLSGNYCRCTGYQSIVDAVVSVSEQESGK
ncbi:MAG: (2Fe-2S)-binding protein [Granulosicoccus sp.]|nr:(2Fe-2S)-binding protein [Granulosicoccus sp.]